MRKTQMPRTLSPFIAVALLTASITVEATPIVVNGGFEAGSLPPWTIIYPATDDAVGHKPSDVINISSDATDRHSGAYGVGIGNPGWTSGGAVIGVVGMISQDVDTVAGQSYHLSYWLKILDAPAGSDLGVVAWGDAKAGCNWADVVPGNKPGVPCGVVPGSWILNPAESDWVQYNFVVTAESNRSTIVLAGRSDYSRVSFDDVTLTPASPVPEPGTLTLLGLGLAGLVSLRRRTR
jgi:hypothetical protein